MMIFLAACSALLMAFFVEEPGKVDTAIAMRAISMFNALVAFLMGLFLCSIIDGWWIVRQDCIGKLWNCILNLCQVIAVHLPEKDMEIKLLILRYGLLSHALIYKYAQQTDDNLQGNSTFTRNNANIAVTQILSAVSRTKLLQNIFSKS